MVTEEALHHPTLGHRLETELERLRQEVPNCSIRLASDKVLDAVCDTVTPQGIVGIVNLPKEYTPPPPPTIIPSHSKEEQKSKMYLLLDGISDPGNVGTLLRSSHAVGIEAVILLPHSCDVWNPKAVRSAMGTTFQVPIRSVSSWDECLELMELCGVTKERIFAATMEGSVVSSQESFDSMAHWDIDWLGGTGMEASAICLGKEGTGLSPPVREAVSQGIIRSVHVPMEEGIESLNAAVCGSVILFEYFRQCRTHATAA